MAVSMKSTMLKLQSYLDASGYFRTSSIGEPKDPPEGLHGAVMLRAYSHPATTLSGTIERRDITLRIYYDALAEPQGNIEFELDEIVAAIEEDLLGDFDLGATVRNIDVTAMTVNFGYQTIANRIYRIADIVVPLIVDDSATFAA